MLHHDRILHSSSTILMTFVKFDRLDSNINLALSTDYVHTSSSIETTIVFESLMKKASMYMYCTKFCTIYILSSDVMANNLKLPSIKLDFTWYNVLACIDILCHDLSDLGLIASTVVELQSKQSAAHVHIPNNLMLRMYCLFKKSLRFKLGFELSKVNFVLWCYT